jgi:hypothetical protein
MTPPSVAEDPIAACRAILTDAEQRGVSQLFTRKTWRAYGVALRFYLDNSWRCLDKGWRCRLEGADELFVDTLNFIEAQAGSKRVEFWYNKFLDAADAMVRRGSGPKDIFTTAELMARLKAKDAERCGGD